MASICREGSSARTSWPFKTRRSSWGTAPIWRHATFQIAPGEFVAILGPNGAGKSTLLRLLLGLLRPSEGSVSVLGRTPQRGNRAIGYVPQRRLIDADLPVRGRDLVMLGLNGLRWGFSLPGATLRQQQARVEEALEAVEATAYADRPIGQLSGGEQQRLFLAQALVGQPRLLLLDEPLASLDLRSQVGHRPTRRPAGARTRLHRPAGDPRCQSRPARC